MSPLRPRVVIIEDHALTREGMKTALSAGFDIVGEAPDGISGLSLVETSRPDVAIVDLGLPGLDGVELTRRIRERVSGTHVVIVTMVDVEEEVIAALAAGADAYSLKSAPAQALADAVRIAGEGGAYFDPRIAHVVLSRFAPRREISPGPLTPRERDVLALISEGHGNTEIASELHIGLGTVKGHIRDILEKLSAADRTQAAVTALRRGLI